MELVDTHCHLQFEKYSDPEAVIKRAVDAGITRMVCVGTNLADSQKAVAIANTHENIWATVGWHPHEAEQYYILPGQIPKRTEDLLRSPKVAAVGECGLDFHYEDSDVDKQEIILRFQIEQLAIKHKLPIVFHVRDAWREFWRIFDSYKGLRGVIHSFTGGPKQLEQALIRGLVVALNGIVTYTQDRALLEAASKLPLDRLVLETDAPFLTPAPDRDQICEPRHTLQTAKFLAKLRGETLEELAAATTANAIKLFSLK